MGKTKTKVIGEVKNAKKSEVKYKEKNEGKAFFGGLEGFYN
jgi:hypothetical protein